jgi:hypothetical protein
MCVCATKIYVSPYEYFLYRIMKSLEPKGISCKHLLIKLFLKMFLSATTLCYELQKL